MGSPDAREIDGIGGGHPLTSKVAVVRPSTRDDADVDYLVLAGRGPTGPRYRDAKTAATSSPASVPSRSKRVWSRRRSDTTDVRIWMENTAEPRGRERPDAQADASVTTATPHIDGVPGTARADPDRFPRRRRLLLRRPLTDRSRRRRDRWASTSPASITACRSCACKAERSGSTGYEEPSAIEANREVCELRRADSPRRRSDDEPRRREHGDRAEDVPAGAGPARRNHQHSNVHPQARPRGHWRLRRGVGGHRLPDTGSVASSWSGSKLRRPRRLDIEHPTGYFSVTLDVRVKGDGVEVNYAALLRTARLLMRGDVFVPSAVWPDA